VRRVAEIRCSSATLRTTQVAQSNRKETTKMTLTKPSKPLPLRGVEPALTVNEAAGIAGCHKATILREIRRGRLRAAKVGSEWRITARHLREYLEDD
jgi:excisionase family DNA binding protein